uniref:Decapping nuclease n=1 Tax=Ixodes ricinus TaxID=34613 RepID=A0A131Y6I6_IXORI
MAVHADAAKSNLPDCALSAGGDFVASLNINGIIDETEKFPSFREPREIGQFSLVGSEREYREGCDQLKYLHMPSHRHRLMWDLNRGYEQAIRKEQEDSREKLDNLLRWIMANKAKFAVNSAAQPAQPHDSASLHTDFVCYRGLLTKLACTPYEAKEDWLVAATLFRGTTYLYAFPTEAEKARNAAQTPRQDRMTFWGRKFEQYMVTGQPGVPPDTNAQVNEREEFCVVARCRLEAHSLVLGAEVDCRDPRATPSAHRPGSTSAYVELKTSRDCLSERQYQSFCRFKLLKWWAQSFLVGIPRVLCGFRDDDGKVGTIEELSVREMPHRAKGLWSGAVCMNFCNRMLSFIKKCVTEDDPKVVHLFRFLPSSRDVVCIRLPKPGDFQILPPWYLDSFGL